MSELNREGEFSYINLLGSRSPIRSFADKPCGNDKAGYSSAFVKAMSAEFSSFTHHSPIER